MIGARLGPYEVLAKIGEGGMGEVYRARDTRLDRAVAIKILPAALAADPSLRERFDREARAVSSLQHPHICALFDVGQAQAGGEIIHFLVLEFLEGETLADRLALSGALPPAEALGLAIEMCDALHAAHRAGIVHRDLKPANVFLVRRGGSSGPSAKLLDFGLAKTAAPAVNAGSLSMLPTTPPGVTAQGAILGTFQYMAPEQIEGLEADARTDIFAFGAVLFEMLTGKPAFEGKTRAQLLGAILKDEPPAASSLQPSVPKTVDRIVATCLAKDPEDRWQSARDLLRELRWAAERADENAPTPVRAAWPGWRARLRWLAAPLVLAIGAAAFGAGQYWNPPTAGDSVQFSIGAPPDSTFSSPPGGGTGQAPQAAVSPDGRTIVFVANRRNEFQLWVRELAGLEARPLPGTEGGAFPFWSPDSRTIGFFAGGKLKRVSLSGGPPLDLCDAPAGRGGTWNRDNVIVFTPVTVGGLKSVSASGTGECADATVLDTEYGETNHRFPSFLPDGRHFLYTATVGTCCPPAKPRRVKIGVLDAAETTVLMHAESSAVYAAGHLLFARDGTLLAQPFDTSALNVSGEQFPLVEEIVTEPSRYASFSISEDGLLVYAGGGSLANTRLTWFDRTGRRLGTVGEPGAYGLLTLSPDERTVAVSTRTGGVPPNRDIALIDVSSGSETRLTFDRGPDTVPVWSPEGRRIAFFGSRSGVPMLIQTPVSGVADEETLLSGADDKLGAFLPTAWSRDEHLLYGRSLGVNGSVDVWWLPIGGDRKPRPYLQTGAEDIPGDFSPDGRWVVYHSTDRAASDVFVQAFPTAGRKYAVSSRGGSNPVWRADGREIVFVAPGGRLMAAAVDTTDGFRADPPVELFTIRTRPSNGRQFAVTRDGGRVLVNALEDQAVNTSFIVVTNALAAVRR